MTSTEGVGPVISQAINGRWIAQAADWLGLAAAPTFALLALATDWLEGGATEALCGSAALSGMATMYWLMSVFHAAAWLRLIARMRRV
jgi:hypothetical protein